MQIAHCVDKKTRSNYNTNMSTHTMHLQREPFRKIAEGRKTIELRLYDEKRRKIKVGDIIRFDCEADTLFAKVKALLVFCDFAQLYRTLDLSKCGYAQGETSAKAEDMLCYYSLERQRQYGVVGIELTLLDSEK